MYIAIPFFLEALQKLSVHDERMCTKYLQTSNQSHYQTKHKPAQLAAKHRAATGENQSWGFLTRSDTNRSVQPQKMARSFIFRI